MRFFQYCFILIFLSAPLNVGAVEKSEPHNFTIKLDPILISFLENQKKYILRVQVSVQTSSSSDWERTIQLKPKLGSIFLEYFYQIFSKGLKKKGATIGEGDFSIPSMNTALYYKTQQIFSPDFKRRVMIEEITLQIK